MEIGTRKRNLDNLYGSTINNSQNRGSILQEKPMSYHTLYFLTGKNKQMKC